MASTQTIVPGSGPGKLYVFLHGLICLVQRSTDVLGLVVDMGEDHSYRAGDWLEEVPFPRGSVFTLKNVTPGTAELNPAKISIIQDFPLFPFPQLYATLIFPTPAQIHSLRRTAIPLDALSGSSVKSLNQPTPGFVTIAALNILEYQFNSVETISVDGQPQPLPWGPPTVFGDTRSATLHFYAEPEGPKPDNHQATEFRSASSLFQGLDLNLTQTATMSTVERLEYPTGLPLSEALSLYEKRIVLSPVAASLKSGDSEARPGVSDGSPGMILCGQAAAKAPAPR